MTMWVGLQIVASWSTYRYELVKITSLDLAQSTLNPFRFLFDIELVDELVEITSRTYEYDILPGFEVFSKEWTDASLPKY